MLPRFIQAALVTAAGPFDELDGSEPSGGARPDADEARKMDLAVGGQALIEGVMMRSPQYLAMAVRTPDRRIVVRKKPFRSVVRRLPFLNVPVLRGGVHLLESMAVGIDALMFSADQAASEDRVEGRKRGFGETAMTWGTVALSFALSLGLFFYVPILLTDLMVGKDSGSVAWNAVDGVWRVAMFVAYLWLVSRLKDMGRVFQYHGAEHMSIHAFENGRPLDADGARPFTTLHPRCGTSFLFFVMLISIVVFSFLGRPQTLGDRLERLAYVPLIGGLAYEAIKLSGKYCRLWLLKPFIWPGLLLQKITTKRPDDDQLTVAMSALRAVLTPEADNFRERVFYDLPSEGAAAAAAAGGGAA